MDIRHIKIQNFKCFNRYSATFCPKANVLIGRNGTGKSTLIHALVKALSFVFSNDKSLGTDFLSAGNNTLNVRGYDTSDFHFDAVTREYADEASIEADGFFYGEVLTWTLFKRNFPNASLYPSLYKDAFLVFMSSAKAPNSQWPLLAYYSDSYPHVYSKITKSTLKVINQDSIPRNFGYYQWDEESACTSLWETRLCNCLAKMQPLYTPASRLASAIHEKETVLNEKELEEDAEYKKLVEDQKRLNETFVPLHDEVDYIQQKLSKFISYLPKVQSDGYDIDFFFATQSEEGYKLTINFKNGKTSLLQDLPAGYRRLFSIVIDMAYRSYILNQGIESNGVVVIDEIDLHLHPALEQVVLNAFCTTFPNIQFFVSTHSVAVISNLDTSVMYGTNVKANQILVMNTGEEEPHALPNLIGVDYNAVLRDFMETPSKNENLKNLEDLYLSYLSMDLKEESQTIYNKILELVGTDAKVLDNIKKKAAEYGIHR